ncbi:hypothetical protein B0T24DRAFT_685252 [Lasiosphaeria ovina]|uniref:Uncharacterized protein n=1 Tax=Lasiosphaeria ovina TaxID=92902 RepID=A0AAE0JS05_9PEZI|nr:hypothetical protein B0T24DRAFT_685252 [Lasiosphaeria ovina]
MDLHAITIAPLQTPFLPSSPGTFARSSTQSPPFRSLSAPATSGMQPTRGSGSGSGSGSSSGSSSSPSNNNNIAAAAAAAAATFGELHREQRKRAREKDSGATGGITRVPVLESPAALRA